MKDKAEIRRILTEELGFVDLAAYRRWIETTRPKLLVTPAMVERLSPDHIDSRAFWQVCDELFGHDPVCNVVAAPRVGVLPHAVESTMDANRLNLRLAKNFGITSFLDENAHERLRVFEIGAGYGSLKSYIETQTAFIYTAVDAVPRLPGVLETTAEGFIPDSALVDGRETYSYVVSSNVFQHLSARQRSRYYRDAHSLLHSGGLFMFNLQIDRGKPNEYLRDKQGNAYCDHYGQFTLVPRADIYDELGPLFDTLYVTQRFDGLFNFVCRKRA
jgi:hypothetical protein